MMVAPTAYPLAWPTHFPRSTKIKTAQFRTSLSGALSNVQASLRLFATDSGKRLTDLVISSNVTLGAAAPKDPGVAVYFTWDEQQVCIPVDCYPKIEHNLQAIHHIIEARRTELRHGSLELVRASLKGFLALPPPGAGEWRAQLGFGPNERVTRETVVARHRSLAADNHPDRGGSTDRAAEINAARDAALREIGQ